MNPITRMFNLFTMYCGDKYKLVFSKQLTEDILDLKLKAFVSSICNMLKAAGFEIKVKKTQKGYDIFYEQNLLNTYNTNLVSGIDKESSLKMQLLVEWGVLMDCTIKSNY